MPIIIRDFNWKQTKNNLTIEVPLKGVPQSKVDVFISYRYIKAIYEQYFFEAILLADIDERNSRCTITATDIIFELSKCAEAEWDSLEPILPKSEKLNLKKNFLEESYKRIQKQTEDLSNKRAELKRLAVSKQIETDTEIRNRIESIRKKEEENALGDIDIWKQSMSVKKRPKQKSIKKISTETIRTTSTTKEETEVIPLRQQKTLEIEFTQREFPTPSRESKLEEENEWLAKQAVARRSCGFISEDIRPEERNPQYIKAKGDELFKNKNYRGAISAYSFGIKISPKFVDFYISRSEAHMALGKRKQYFLWSRFDYPSPAKFCCCT